MTPRFFAAVCTVCVIALSLWAQFPHDAVNWGAVVVGSIAAPFFFYYWANFILVLQERYGMHALLDRNHED